MKILISIKEMLLGKPVHGEKVDYGTNSFFSVDLTSPDRNTCEGFNSWAMHQFKPIRVK